jgi:hypothetical protein
MPRHVRGRRPGSIRVPTRCTPGLSRVLPAAAPAPGCAPARHPGQGPPPCPECGGRGAVGWQRRSGDVDEPVPEEPVEFDCLHGCTLTAAHLRVFAASHRQLH